MNRRSFISRVLTLLSLPALRSLLPVKVQAGEEVSRDDFTWWWYDESPNWHPVPDEMEGISELHIPIWFEEGLIPVHPNCRCVITRHYYPISKELLNVNPGTADC